MTHRHAGENVHLLQRAWDALRLSAFLCFVCQSGYAQESRPAGIDFDGIMASAYEVPLQKPETFNRDGKPLTSDQAAELKSAETAMTEAEALRLKPDFVGAAASAEKAAKVRESVLGPSHYLTVSSQVLLSQMRMRMDLAKEKQSQLHKADQQVAQAKELLDSGKYSSCQVIARKALGAYEKCLPAEDVDLAGALLTIGSADIELSLIDEAELMLTRALGIYQNVYGQGHPILGRVYDRLGWMTMFQASREGFQGEKARKAVDYFNRAIRIMSRTVGENGDFAEALDNRGTIQKYIGNDEDAVRNKFRALVIREKVLGPEARDTGVSYSNIAWLYGEMGQYDRVLPLRKKAMTVFQKALAPDHPFFMLEKGNLARDLIRMGQAEEGVKLFEEMHTYDEEHGVKLDVGALERAVELGTAYVKVGRAADAIALFDLAMERSAKLRESDKKQEAITTLLRIIRTCNSYRLHEDAVRFNEKIVAWDDADRGRNDSVDLAQRLAALGSLYAQIGRYDDARKALEKSIERLKKLTGNESLDVAAPMLTLARACSMSGDLAKAARICEDVVRISEAHTGSDSVATAYAMMWLGRINALQKKFAESEFNLSEAQSILDKASNNDPAGRMRILQERAFCLGLKGEKKEAVKLLKEALEIARKWADAVEPCYSHAAIVEILKYLLDFSEDSDSETKAERDVWRSEFKTYISKLESDRAIGAEEREWKKQYGG